MASVYVGNLLDFVHYYPPTFPPLSEQNTIREPNETFLLLAVKKLLATIPGIFCFTRLQIMQKHVHFNIRL